VGLGAAEIVDVPVAVGVADAVVGTNIRDEQGLSVIFVNVGFVRRDTLSKGTTSEGADHPREFVLQSGILVVYRFSHAFFRLGIWQWLIQSNVGN
jgi:hypothetical protein